MVHTVRDRVGQELDRKVTLDQMKILRARRPNEQEIDPDIYRVDKLLDVKTTADTKGVVGRQFLVKWTGWDKPTWEPEYNLQPHMVRRFLNNRRRQSANLVDGPPAPAASSSSSSSSHRSRSRSLSPLSLSSSRTVRHVSPSILRLASPSSSSRTPARASRRVVFDLNVNTDSSNRQQQQSTERAARSARRRTSITP